MPNQSRPVKRKPQTGIEERHARSCRGHQGGACNCDPTYRAWVWDKRAQITAADGTISYGGRIKKSFPTMAAAKAWRADALSQMHRGQLSAPSKRTLREAAEAWLAGAEAEPPTVVTRGGQPYKPSVLRGYRADLTNVILPELGAIKLAELRRSDLQRLADRLRAKGASPSRVKNTLMPLRALYRWELRRDDGLATNPTRDLELASDEGHRDRVATPEEAEQLFAVLPDAERAIYGCAFYSGLRRGELRGLRWDDVDLAKGVLHVRRSWDDQAGAVAPKSRKGTRGVPINGKLRDYLDEQKARTDRSGSDFVFGATATSVFVPTTVGRRAQAAWKAENVKRAKAEQKPLVPIGLHECRHSYVSWMFAAGHTLEEIGDYIGHSSAYMTDRYRHFLEGHERRSVERQDEYLGVTAVLRASAVKDLLREILEGAEPDELAEHSEEIRALVDGYLERADTANRIEQLDE